MYDRKGCTYSTFGLYERLARWKRRKDYYNKMDNDIPENQQDRKIAVSAIKHLDQSKKRENTLIAVVSLFKENWLYEKFRIILFGN